MCAHSQLTLLCTPLLCLLRLLCMPMPILIMLCLLHACRACCAAQFDERVARGLDFIVSEAGKYGIKVTLVLLNQWKRNNGVSTFEEW